MVHARRRVHRLAAPAPTAASAVAETARVAPALLLVFRRLLLPAPPGLALLTASVRIHQKVHHSAGVTPTVVVLVVPRATVLPGNSA